MRKVLDTLASMQTPIQIIVARIFLYVHIQGQLKEFS
jgi:hypothetical protein